MCEDLLFREKKKGSHKLVHTSQVDLPENDEVIDNAHYGHLPRAEAGQMVSDRGTFTASSTY